MRLDNFDLNLLVAFDVLLQERSVTPLGSSKSVQVDISLVCATHRRLREEVALGTFREDLYYRLNVITIHVPHLRDRKEDIPALSQHFLKTFYSENDITIPCTQCSLCKQPLKASLWAHVFFECENLSDVDSSV